MKFGAKLNVDRLGIGYRVGGNIFPAVSDISLEISPGKVLGLVGESGSGKSTLAYSIVRHLSNSAVVTGGEIRFDEENLLSAKRDRIRELRRNSISMVYQDPQASLNPTMTIGKQVRECFLQKTWKTERKSTNEVCELLERVQLPAPSTLINRYPHELSGGEKQRVIVAMALAVQPRLLICDEPTTALDSTTSIQIIDLIKKLNSEIGVTVLFITHDLAIVSNIADRLAVMEQGRLVEIGETRAVLRNPEAEYTQKLLESSISPLKSDTTARYDLPQRSKSSENSPTSNIQKDADLEKTFCRLNNLHVAYGRERFFDRFRGASGGQFFAVRNVNLEIGQGETFGLVGESGCGKSTLAKTIAGLADFEGEISFCGMEYTQRKELDKFYNRNIQIIFQHADAALNPRKKVSQILGRVVQFCDRTSGHVRGSRVRQLMNMVHLPISYLEKFPHELSGGEKQRVCIARAIAMRPKFIVCDEITSGLDVSVQSTILQLLVDLQRSHEVAYLFISHDLNIVQQISHRFAVMYLGEILELRTAERMGSPYHPYTEALFSAVPSLTGEKKAHQVRLEGSRPDPRFPPSGCTLHDRCHRKIGDICEDHKPQLRQVGSQHCLSCHIPREELEAVPSVWQENLENDKGKSNERF